MNVIAEIGKKVPNFKVSEWVQGLPTNFDNEKDKIVLVEVFQVNCPGCFMYGIPMAIDIYNKYRNDGVIVIGIATAFEDFDKNTLENLKLLVDTSKVIGETKKILAQYKQLDNEERLRYRIPFPIAMDSLIKQNEDNVDSRTMDLIHNQIPDFDLQSKEYKQQIINKATEYIKSKKYVVETFEQFALKGTPSTILVDRKGILRDTVFGQMGDLESKVIKLLKE